MPSPYYTDDAMTVFHGDCLDVLPTLAAESVDAVVCDPPYELAFMGRKWDASGVAFNPDVWRECLRVLKPGGHLLAFGGSRTWHRLAVAIEDAGFEMRDSIAWLYGSGFPKSMDVSKAIDKAAGATREVVGQRDRYLDGKARRNLGDRNEVYGSGLTANGVADLTAPATPAAQQWSGWGTALKPAFEPIVVARKPLIGTVAANVLEHGTGALNIDGCRVSASGRPLRESKSEASVSTFGDGLNGSRHAGATDQGRWPTNVVLDGDAADALDEQSGTLKSGGIGDHILTRERSTQTSKGAERDRAGKSGHGDSGGASRFFPVFRYQAKAPTKERPVVIHDDGTKTAHPTVKPLALMRWLVRLVTPPGGTVLDPFLGSGTTAQAARDEGFRCIGIERDPDYVRLIRARLAAEQDALPLDGMTA